MQQIVGVKFRNTAKVYYFSPAPGEEYSLGATVIVETAKGLECGTVTIPLKEVEDAELIAALKPILRLATEKDLEKIRKNEERRPEAMKICREQIEKHHLDMKLIDCEFTLDGTKVVFYFSAPTRVDFRDLVRDLAGEFHLRIELRQVGIRDETRILGGIAPCGRPCCCSCGLSDFKKVTIKMAKTQGLSLNPGKISGLCGRLMCCLDYENDYYASVCKQMPKIGAEVISPDGRGTVVSVNMLKMEAKIKIETKEGGMIYKDFPVSGLQVKRNGQFEKNGEPVDAEEERAEETEDAEEVLEAAEEIPSGQTEDEVLTAAQQRSSDARPFAAQPAQTSDERRPRDRKNFDRKNFDRKNSAHKNADGKNRRDDRGGNAAEKNGKGGKNNRFDRNRRPNGQNGNKGNNGNNGNNSNGGNGGDRSERRETPRERLSSGTKE